jgi:hypothetical protein
VATAGTGSNIGSVTVAWDAVVGATSYLVQKKDAIGSVWVDACNITDINARTCTIYGLMAGHTYYFLVTAINGSGSGSGGGANVTTNTLASSSPSTLPTVLGQLTGLVGTPGTDTNSDKVTLAWNALTGAESYTVAVAGPNSQTFTLVTCSNTQSTSCVVPGLIGGYTYTFEVNGIGRDGSNNYGQGIAAQVAVAVNTYVPPTFSGGGAFVAPVSPVPAQLPLSATKMTAKAGDRQVQLTWEAPADTNRTNWEIESSLDGSTWTAAAQVSGSALTTAIGNLKNGTNYIFRLTPVGAGGKNLPVNASALPGIESAEPQGFSAQPGDASVVLTWTAPANSGGLPVKTYVVEQSTDGNTWSQVSSVEASQLSAYIAGLTNFTEYRFRIAAVTDFGRGKYAALTASPSVLPTAPLSLKLVSVGPEKVVVGWELVAGGSSSTISGYKVEFSLDGKSWSTAATTASSATSATVTGLTNGKTYQIRVSPVTATGTGASSVILGTPATVPGIITGITPVPTSGKMTLTFAQPKNNGGLGIDYYVAEVATSANGPWTVAVENSGSALTRIDISELKNGATYFFRIKAVNQIGAGPASAPISAVPGAAATAPAFESFRIVGKNVSVSWGVPTDTGGKPISSYIVEVSADGRKWTTATTVKAGSRTASVALAKKAQLLRIRAVTSYGKGVPSLAIRVPGLGR